MPARDQIHEVGGNMATVNPASIQPKTTTAEDTLQRKSRDASVISGGHLVAKALKNEGVDTIFTLCGGHIIDINDGCVDEGIRIIDVRHEQVAAHASDGYARQTGKLGCVVTTAGPGCTNAVTGKRQARRKWMAQLQDVEATATEKLMPLFKYGEERGNVGNLLSDVPFSKFAEMLGGHGEEVRDPAQIAGALRRAREAIHRTGRSAVVNIWADPREYAPGTKNQTMFK